MAGGAGGAMSAGGLAGDHHDEIAIDEHHGAFVEDGHGQAMNVDIDVRGGQAGGNNIAITSINAAGNAGGGF